MRRTLRYSPLWQITLSKLRELVREPEAVFWVFVFPVLLALALGIAFRSGGPKEIAVGVQEGRGAEETAAILEEAPGVRPVTLAESEAREQLRSGNVALVVIPGDPVGLWFDPTRQESGLARLSVDRALQRAAGREDVVRLEERKLEELGSRYIDFLIPGLLGMNLMGTGMWGIGFYIVKARSQRLLKRLVASPMRRSHFLAGQILGRLVFLVPEVGLLLVFAHYAFGVPVRGSLLSLGLVSGLGAMTFAGLGLLVASRSRTIEGVSGLMNAAMVPMWIGSGIFFSASRFPEIVQPLIQALPLTAVNDALRAIMLDGATLVQVADELAIATGWGVVSFAAAFYLFRWR